MSRTPHPGARWSAWVNSWTLVSLPGACAAVLVWGVGATVGMAAVVALPLTLVLVLCGLDRGRWDGETTGVGGRGWIGRVVLCAVAIVLGLNTAGMIAPGLALLIALGALGTAPPAVARWRTLLSAADPHQIQRPSAHVVVPQIASQTLETSSAAVARLMSDVELCRAWRRSYWRLREAPHADDKLDVVIQRQCLLDELEARHSAALHTWFASGGRASGSPERFLADGGGDQSTAA